MRKILDLLRGLAQIALEVERQPGDARTLRR